MIDYNHSLLIILVAAAVTFLIRALPFILFRGSTPASVVYLSNVLPYAIMGMLVVYCLKSVSYTHLDVYKRQRPPSLRGRNR